MTEHNNDTSTIPLPLTCRKCGGDFYSLIDAERLRELYDEGVPAEDIAASFSTATLSQQLLCLTAKRRA